MNNNTTTRLSKWTPTTDLMMLRRMGKLIEELGELQAVAARCIIQGIDEIDPSSGKTNRVRLEHETADVIAQCFTTIKALGLDNDAIQKRAHEKQRQMAEWEAMFAHEGEPAAWPMPGDLVRYKDGVTALALHGDPHAGGWHGLQCMGGYTFYSNVYPPSEADRQTWVDCAVRYRHKSLEEAEREAGLLTSTKPAQHGGVA